MNFVSVSDEPGEHHEAVATYVPEFISRSVSLCSNDWLIDLFKINDDEHINNDGLFQNEIIARENSTISKSMSIYICLF